MVALFNFTPYRAAAIALACRRRGVVRSAEHDSTYYGGSNLGNGQPLRRKTAVDGYTHSWR